MYSQDNEWYWNEETKDVVYETPNSKFVKKWYRWNESFELLANGTFKMTQRTWVEDYGLYSIIYFSGTWKRTDKMTLEIRWSNVTYTGDQTAVSKLSARKRDELKKVFAEASRVWKAKYVGKTEKYSILRIDNDHLILRGYDVQKWYSEKRKKEYELQRQKEAEEARKAEELRKAEEARKAEAERKAKEEAKKAEEERKAKEEAEKARKMEEYAIRHQEYLQSLSPEKQESVMNAYTMGVELVDLGLSVRWANMNLGANSPEEIGDRFSWGEIEPTQEREDRNYRPVAPDNVDFLDENSDPATVKLGIGFHTPTVQQWKELKKKCKKQISKDQEFVTFIGPNGNSITIPFFTYWSNQRYESWEVLEYRTGGMFGGVTSCRPIRPVME